MFILYYSYVEIKDPATVCAEQRKLCEELHLLGRIRVSFEGLNGTLNGTERELEEYIQRTDALFGPIHWKRSTYLPEKEEQAQKFTTLSCQVTKEVVSLDLPEEETEVMKATPPGVHLTPVEFHQELDKALTNTEATDGTNDTSSGNSSSCNNDDRDLVLIDVRNIYETRIGAFEVPSGCKRIQKIDPCTRKFSDFTKVIDDNIDKLKEKKILMYCTGGVRCERASSYLRTKGLDSVFQLYGGIHNYMENFPTGGYFKGKNFVYDPRRAVPCQHGTENVIGKCFYCAKLYDDYSAEIRCSQCRMLVLVCDDCQSSSQQEVQNFIATIKCERCKNVGSDDIDASEAAVGNGSSDNHGTNDSNCISKKSYHRFKNSNSEDYKIEGQEDFFPVEFNAYDILGVAENASKDDIKSCHKKLISKYHPAKAQSHEEKNEHERRLLIYNQAFRFIGGDLIVRDAYDYHYSKLVHPTKS